MWYGAFERSRIDANHGEKIVEKLLKIAESVHLAIMIVEGAIYMECD